MTARPGLSHAAAAALLFAATLIVFWPGIALYDSVEQYRQAISGAYDDWHPPVMARLWSLLLGAWPGTAPMFLLQTALYWLGLGLFAVALARRGRNRAAWLALAAGAAAVLPCWMAAVLKDGQMVGALTAAVGLIAWFALAERPRPFWARVATVLLLLYALLLRANAAFAVVPLAFALFGWWGLKSRSRRTVAVLVATAAAILLTPDVNRNLLGAERSGVENSLLAYDIAGAAVRDHARDVAGVPAPRWAALRARGCYNVTAWDRLGQPDCLAAPGLAANPEVPPLYGLWLKTVAHHPLAYLRHRLAHFDSTLRLFVPRGLPEAVSPVDPEPNRLGLGAEPGPAARAVLALGNLWTALPLAWPAFWLALAPVGLWAAAEAEPGPERDIAFALLLSACCGGASFLLVSVASDLRYHLWTMLAAMLGLLLAPLKPHHLRAMAGIGAAVVLLGTAGRLLLPPL
ncbi:MAG: hypothetical protein QOK17_61 [Sphingomonadales bacterium]|nr:hypothetical protein [Sphingomonadales bacterium]